MAVVALEPSRARHAGFDAGAVGTASGAPRDETGPPRGPATPRAGDMREGWGDASARSPGPRSRRLLRNADRTQKPPNVHAPVKSNHDAVRLFADQYLAMKTRR